MTDHLRGAARAWLPAFRPPARAAGFLLFLGLALGLSFPYFEATRNANELPRLMQAMARVDTGVWAIDGPGARRLAHGPDVSRSRVDGRVYPNKPPGTTLVLAAAYRIARIVHGDELTLRLLTWWGRMISGWLPTVALCWFLARRLSREFSRGPALAAVAVYALATPASAYAHLAYGHQLAAALLTVGATLCIDASTSDPRAGPGSAPWQKAAVGGALAAAAVTVEYGAVFAGVPLGLFLAWAGRSRARLPATVAAGLGALLPVAALAAYHRAVFGSVLSTGYHHVVRAEFAAKHGQGFLGLSQPTLDGFFTHVLEPGGGLLWWAPLFPLAIYGLLRASAYEDNPVRSQARVFVVTFAVYLAVVSGLSFDGGWRVGPRYLVAVLPMLAWGWAEALGQVRTRALWLIPVLGAAGYAMVVNALAANLWPHFDLASVHHPVSEVLFPLWRDGVEPYSVLRSTANITAVRSVIAFAVVGGLWALLRDIEPRPTTLLAAAAGLLLATAAVLGVSRWPPHALARKNLAYILRAWEPEVEPQLRRPSRPLPPLASGVVDRGPQRRPAMVPPS